MPKSKNKKENRKDALLEMMLEMMLENKPEGGENFWVFSLIQDDDKPTWDQRYSTLGTYEQCASDMVRILGMMADNKISLNGVKVASYQGENARKYLTEIEIEEARYQQEAMNQPNN